MRPGRPSNTAQYVALVRAVLHDKGALDDPYAAGMLTSTMRCAAAVLRRFPRLTESSLYSGLGVRTITFDDALVDAIASGITQVVTVAAGYDARPWRFAAPGVRFFEVDHPATQAEKRRRAPAPLPIFVPCDLRTDSLVEALARHGFDRAERAIFLIEGLTMYLSVAEVSMLLDHAAEAAAAGSRLVVNFAVPKGAAGAAERRNRWLAFGGWLRGEPFGEARNVVDPVALVEDSPWRDAKDVVNRVITASI